MNFFSKQTCRNCLLLFFLFFAAYVICKKNYSFSRVAFLFFQSETANSFYSKINDSSRIRTTRFSSSRSGVRVSVVPNIFKIYPQHFSIPEMSETPNTKGFLYEMFRYCETQQFRRKIVIPPSLLSLTFFNTRN